MTAAMLTTQLLHRTEGTTQHCIEGDDIETVEVLSSRLSLSKDEQLRRLPQGAVCWITKALAHAWSLPRFEAAEFATAFVAANKPSAKTRRMDYIVKAERATNPERKLHLLKAAEEYGPGTASNICNPLGPTHSGAPGSRRWNQVTSKVGSQLNCGRAH
jgi:hypothetical protein